MAIEIRKTTLVDISKEEFEHIMFCRKIKFLPTGRGLIFLKRIKLEMPFGTCELINQNGEPWRFKKAIADDLIKLPIETAGA